MCKIPSLLVYEYSQRNQRNIYSLSVRMSVIQRECNIPANTRRLHKAALMLGHRRRWWPNIKPALGKRPVFAGIYTAAKSPKDSRPNCFIFQVSSWPVADPGSEKRGAPGVLGACPQDFLMNFSQFKVLFKVFGENKVIIRK